MPVVFRWKGCRFFFFSNEGDPREPLHIHVRRQGARAKFWIEPVSVSEILVSRRTSLPTWHELSKTTVF